MLRLVVIVAVHYSTAAVSALIYIFPLWVGNTLGPQAVGYFFGAVGVVIVSGWLVVVVGEETRALDGVAGGLSAVCDVHRFCGVERRLSLDARDYSAIRVYGFYRLFAIA